MKTIAPLILLATTLALTGCAYLTEPPTPENGRLVTQIVNPVKKIVVHQPMVYGDQHALLTKGIGLPAGVYMLEAEDSQYWYFRSLRPLEYRTFQHRKVAEDDYKPGGIYLSKIDAGSNSLVAAGAYLTTADPSRKVLIWPLGGDFLKAKGSRWTANF